MPPYEVRANRILPRPENWLRVTVPALVLERGENALVAPGYYVLSNLSEQNTRLFINELQLRQFAGTLLWPMLVQTQPRQPAVVILDRGHSAGERRWAGISGSEWVGDPLGTAHRPNIMSTEGIATGLQWLEINSTPFIDRAGDPAGGVEAGDDSAPLPAGFVDAAMRGDCVVAWVSAGAPLAGFMRPSEERLAAAVNEEQMTLTLYAFSRRPPLWFIIGMRRLIAATEVSRTRITFARPAFAAPSRIGSDISRNAQAFIEGRGWGQSPETTSLRSSAVPQITLPQLLPLLGKAEGFTYEETMLASALVHYGLYGDNGKHRQKFM
ncbi:MAG: hypothetical protein LBI02_12420, partial [Opitutaceae bacterium]|nr:hypothetical protein [Opitutaceae bacterium]